MKIKAKKPVGRVRKSTLRPNRGAQKSTLRPNKSVKKLVKRAMPSKKATSSKKNSVTWQNLRQSTHNGGIKWVNGMPSTPAPKQKPYKKPGNYSTGIGVGY